MGWDRLPQIVLKCDTPTHYRWCEKNLSTAYYNGPPPAQCGGCAFFIPLESATGSDWGACANAASAHDGRLMFEHDSCPQVTPDSAVIDLDYLRYRRNTLLVLRAEVRELERELEVWKRACPRCGYQLVLRQAPGYQVWLACPACEVASPEDEWSECLEAEDAST